MKFRLPEDEVGFSEPEAVTEVHIAGECLDWKSIRSSMEKRLLHQYLVRLAQGEDSLRRVVCLELTRETVYVPTEGNLFYSNSPRSAFENQVQVQVKSCDSQAGLIVPVFTSQNLFKSWCAVAAHSPQRMIALLAGDLCLALPKSASIALNLGSDRSVVLTSEDLRLVADKTSAVQIRGPVERSLQDAEVSDHGGEERTGMPPPGEAGVYIRRPRAGSRGQPHHRRDSRWWQHYAATQALSPKRSKRSIAPALLSSLSKKLFNRLSASLCRILALVKMGSVHREFGDTASLPDPSAVANQGTQAQ